MRVEGELAAPMSSLGRGEEEALKPHSSRERRSQSREEGRQTSEEKSREEGRQTREEKRVEVYLRGLYYGEDKGST